MPNRTIREGFLDSSKIDQLDWFAECVYHRMLLAADHAGRLDGRSSVLKARLFPLKSCLRESDIQRAVNQISKAGLTVSWTAPNGQEVLQLTNWHRDSRAATSRYPDPMGRFEIRYVRQAAPTEEGEIWVVESSIVSHQDGIGMGSVSHSKNDRTINDRTINDNPSASAEGCPADCAAGPPRTGPPELAAFEEWWKHYPRKEGKQAAFRAYQKARKRICQERQCNPSEARQQLLQKVREFASSPKAKGQFCPLPATWLNQGRYDDDPTMWTRSDAATNSSPARVRRDDWWRQHPASLLQAGPDAADPDDGSPIPPPIPAASVGADSQALAAHAPKPR